MTITQIGPRTVEQPAPVRRTRIVHSPLRQAPTMVKVAIAVRTDTEIEVVRLSSAGATTVIFRDSATGTAVEVTLPDADLVRMLGLVEAVAPVSA